MHKKHTAERECDLTNLITNEINVVYICIFQVSQFGVALDVGVYEDDYVPLHMYRSHLLHRIQLVNLRVLYIVL
jgi:hypothetical protein